MTDTREPRPTPPVLMINPSEKPEYVSAKNEIVDEFIALGGNEEFTEREKTNWMYRKAVEYLVELKRLRRKP